MPKKWGSDLYLLEIDGETVKLGRSQHPAKRLQEIARAQPFSPVRLYCVWPGAGCLEAGLHRLLAARFEKRLEWYRASPAAVARVVLAQLETLEF